METALKDVLLSLGITKNYAGYKCLCRALEMSLEDENRLICVKKGIWEPLEQEFHYGGKGVESAIRTISNRAWCDNRENLEKLAGSSLSGPPSAVQFLSILHTRLARDEEEKAAEGGRQAEHAAIG